MEKNREFRKKFKFEKKIRNLLEKFWKFGGKKLWNVGKILVWKIKRLGMKKNGNSGILKKIWNLHKNYKFWKKCKFGNLELNWKFEKVWKFGKFGKIWK